MNGMMFRMFTVGTSKPLLDPSFISGQRARVKDANWTMRSSTLLALARGCNQICFGVCD